MSRDATLVILWHDFSCKCPPDIIFPAALTSTDGYDCETPTGHIMWAFDPRTDILQEKNYRTYCAQNDITLDDGPCDPNDNEEEMDLDAADEWEGIMDIDEDEDELPQFFKEERDRKRDEKMANPTKRKKKGKVSELIRSKVRKVLDACELISSKKHKSLTRALLT
jgi:hypothetical protein